MSEAKLVRRNLYSVGDEATSGSESKHVIPYTYQSHNDIKRLKESETIYCRCYVNHFRRMRKNTAV